MGLHLTVPIIALNFLSELPLQALQLFFCARAGFNDVLHIQTPKPVRKLIAAVGFRKPAGNNIEKRGVGMDASVIIVLCRLGHIRDKIQIPEVHRLLIKIRPF